MAMERENRPARTGAPRKRRKVCQFCVDKCEHIDYKTEGYYVLMSFTSDPAFPKELDRILGITDGILRSMIVCKDE